METFLLDKMQFWEKLMSNVSVPIPEDVIIVEEKKMYDNAGVANGRVTYFATYSTTLLASISLRVLAI